MEGTKKLAYSHFKDNILTIAFPMLEGKVDNVAKKMIFSDPHLVTYKVFAENAFEGKRDIMRYIMSCSSNKPANVKEIGKVYCNQRSFEDTWDELKK